MFIWKKISGVGDDEMTKQRSFSSRGRGPKGRFSSGRNQTAAVNAKLRKMNMARQKCKRKLDTETDDSTVQEDAALNIITRNGLVSKTTRLLLNNYCSHNPRANGAKRRSGRKPGARVTNRA